jgi:V8-like Glu-specific endopeptidase
MGTKLPHQDRTLLLYALSDLPQFATVRGRQTVVRNALGGYELTSDVDKRLRWLDWEGGPIEVADALIQLFDGYEPTPGIPALGLIAQAIEPLVGPPHVEKLSDLRRRLNWGADLDPASPETWRDERSPAEVVRERIIGENTLRPIYYLHNALRAADAVVRIDVPGVGSGTGFLVAPDLMMTNHHVIANADQARLAEVSFFYELDIDKRERPMRTVGTADTPLLFTDKDLDVTLVRLADPPKLAHYLPIRPVRLEQDQRVAIIQHPGGFLKKISMQNNLVAFASDKLVQYYTSTQAGSSGSPVLDDDFAVVAIHHSAVRDKDWDGGGRVRQPAPNQSDPKQLEDLQWRNQGTSMIAVRGMLKEQAPELLAEMTIVD